MATKKKAPSVQALQDLNSPDLSDDQFVQAADQQGAQLGAGQWLDHTNALRTKQVTNAIAQPAAMTSANPAWLSNPVGDAIHQQGMANAIDPTGVLGYFDQHSQSGQDPAALLKKKQATASLAALTQVAQ